MIRRGRLGVGALDQAAQDERARGRQEPGGLGPVRGTERHGAHGVGRRVGAALGVDLAQHRARAGVELVREQHPEDAQLVQAQAESIFEPDDRQLGAFGERERHALGDELIGVGELVGPREADGIAARAPVPIGPREPDPRARQRELGLDQLTLIAKRRGRARRRRLVGVARCDSPRLIGRFHLRAPLLGVIARRHRGSNTGAP